MRGQMRNRIFKKHIHSSFCCKCNLMFKFYEKLDHFSELALKIFLLYLSPTSS